MLAQKPARLELITSLIQDRPLLFTIRVKGDFPPTPLEIRQ
jgi:hypothetical protein